MEKRINPLDYLPELYQNCENSFTERFLTIFTDIYSQFEREIDTSSKIYDPELCPDEFIEWLGKWISVENMQLFPDDKKRELLLLTPWLSKHRGIISGMKKLLKLYCGTDVFIVEYYHVKRYFSSCKELERIYNGGRFTVWIICPPIKNRVEALSVIVSSQIPANITAKIKILSNITELNNYCYLGINSVLSGMEQGILDGKSAMDYVYLGRDKQ